MGFFKMKETKTAKENVELQSKFMESLRMKEIFISLNICNEHKQTCQRWLEFLEDETNYLWTISNKEICELKEDKISKKITDLKQAIKLYEENGI